MIRFLLLSVLLFTGAANLFSQKFYEVDSPEKAEVKLFYVEDESVCDLKIFFVYEEKDAVKPGHWMEVPDEANADIKVIFVDEQNQADMNVCMTFTSDGAGWINTDKKNLLPF